MEKWGLERGSDQHKPTCGWALRPWALPSQTRHLLSPGGEEQQNFAPSSSVKLNKMKNIYMEEMLRTTPVLWVS